MCPLRFGPADALVGLHHDPAPFPSRGGVLLCGSPGPEAPGLHRTLRVLADRLARAGFHVLRFDYYATGDSLGEPEEGRITRWECDVKCAHTELTRISGDAPVSWVGFGLGATIAARAAATLPAPLNRLALWDPVLDGAAYLERLTKLHDMLLDRVLGPRARVRRDDPPTEVLGLALPAELQEEFGALRIDGNGPPWTHRLVLLAAQERAHDWLSVRPDGARTEFVAVGGDDWSGAEVLETTILRTDIVNAVYERVASDD